MTDTSGTDQQEPSMEEILASIRRIIAEDGEEETEGEDAPPEGEPEQAAAESSTNWRKAADSSRLSPANAASARRHYSSGTSV